jgi:hypothetical protein
MLVRNGLARSIDSLLLFDVTLSLVAESSAAKQPTSTGEADNRKRYSELARRSKVYGSSICKSAFLQLFRILNAEVSSIDLSSASAAVESQLFELIADCWSYIAVICHN